MGKKIVIITFLSVFAYALFFASDKNLLILNKSDSSSTPLPRMLMESFRITKFDKAKVNSSLAGELGYFLNPNILKLEGNIRARSYTANNVNIRANAATAYFESESVTDVTKNSDILRVILEESVKIKHSDNLIATEYAEYLVDDDVMFSLNPVKIYNRDSIINGDSGFRYKPKSQKLELFGKTSGELFKHE